MANLEIKNPPVFTTEVPKVRTEDFITAELENEIKGKLLNNTVFLKAIVEEAIKHMETSEIHVTTENKQSWDKKAETSTATAENNGLMSNTDKTKLDNIADRAEVNQNAITTVNAGGTVVEANSKTAQIAIVAGDNVTIEGNNATKQIEISSNGGNADTLGNHKPEEVVKLGGKHLAGQGASGGYSFLGDGSEDTGMFSDGDGDLYFMQNSRRINFIPTTASCNKNWNWSGQEGQPSWVWGGNDGTNMYVYNPSNFRVNYANSAGDTDTLDGVQASGFSRATQVRLGIGIAATVEGGSSNTAEGYCAHVGGDKSVASGYCAFAQGEKVRATGSRSSAEGYDTEATGTAAATFGSGTKATGWCHFAIGKHNIDDSNNTFVNPFIIGNGSDTSNRANIFRVHSDGNTYAKGTYNTGGADYAEYFEWVDANQDKEDRVGYFVTLDGDKIKIAHPEDRFILGIISATPSVMGNSYEDQWEGRELKDEWKRIIYDEVEIPEEKDEEGNIITEARKEMQPKLNPDYDNTKPYLGRSQRPEWSAVGMLGQLLVRDDGTCEVNGYCKCGDGGIATASEIGYRVMSRVTDNIIKILFR